MKPFAADPHARYTRPSVRHIQFIGGSWWSSIVPGAYAAFGRLAAAIFFYPSATPDPRGPHLPTDRSGVEDRRWAGQRVILQLGRAFWSLATPASVTCVPQRSSFRNCVSPFKCSSSTSVTP